MTHPPGPMDRRSDVAITALVIWMPLLAIIGLTVLLAASTDVTIRQLTQDPTTVLGAPFYIGAVSNLGNVLWASGATVCLFTGLSLSRAIGSDWRRFLLVSGAFTTLLMLDDLFLIHDEIVPTYAGISGDAYGILYVLGMLGYLVAFRKRIRQTSWLVLTTALALFATSALVDVGSSRLSDLLSPSVVILVEDAAKLLAIGTWLAYFAFVARQVVSAAVIEAALGQTVVEPERPRDTPTEPSH